VAIARDLIQEVLCFSFKCAKIAAVTNFSEVTEPAPSIKHNRVVTIVFDGVLGLLAVAGITVLVVGLASTFLASSLLVVLGVWTALVSAVALPALAVLYLTPPRVPLKERSALVATASWFGRVAWASVVFALAIVLGSIAGVVASKTEASDGLSSTIAILFYTVFWPTVFCVVAITFVIVAIRWCLDLGRIVAEGGGARVRDLLETRWTGPFPSRWVGLIQLLVGFGVAGVSRVALILTLITVAWNVVSAVAILIRSFALLPSI